MTKSERRGPEEWRQIIYRQQTSGMTVARYCRDRGVTEYSFYNWKKRLRGAAPTRQKHSSIPAFVEVTPLNPAKTDAIIKRLYAIEDRGKEVDVEARLALRQRESVPILAALKDKLFGWRDRLLPKHPMAEAVGPHQRSSSAGATLTK